MFSNPPPPAPPKKNHPRTPCNPPNPFIKVHISLAGSSPTGVSDGMSVSWSTPFNTSSSVVLYRESTLQPGGAGARPGPGEPVESEETGEAVRYYETFHHHVVLKNLKASTRYEYAVGDGVNYTSFDYSFVTAPDYGSFLKGEEEDEPVKFSIFGDLGLVNGGPTMEYLKSSSASDLGLIFNLGDVGYADDSFLHYGCMVTFCYEEKFDEYMREMEGIISKVPMMTTPGNHEADCHDPACLVSSKRREKLSNFTAYNARFRMPSEETGGVMNMWYSFNYGPVHFVALDLETGFPGSAEERRYVLPCGGFGDQLKWLESDLKAANEQRHLRPWVILGGHHPMYSKGKVDPKMSSSIEWMLQKYQVDFFVAGHEHSYERNYPMYYGSPSPPRPTTARRSNGGSDYGASSSFSSSDSTLDFGVAAVSRQIYSQSKTNGTIHLLIGGPGNDEQDDSAGGSTRALQLLKMYPNLDASKGSKDRWHDGLVDVGEDTVAFEDLDNYGIGVFRATRGEICMEYVRTRDGSVKDKVCVVK